MKMSKEEFLAILVFSLMVALTIKASLHAIVLHQSIKENLEHKRGK